MLLCRLQSLGYLQVLHFRIGDGSCSTLTAVELSDYPRLLGSQRRVLYQVWLQARWPGDGTLLRMRSQEQGVCGVGRAIAQMSGRLLRAISGVDV